MYLNIADVSVRRFFSCCLGHVWDYLLDLVLSLIWGQHQTVIFRLGMCCRQAIRPSCPSLALTAVFVCDMQMSPFFFFLFFWVEVSTGCRQRRLLTLTVKWASLCKSIGCSAGQRFIYRDALTPDTDDANCKQMVLPRCTVFSPLSPLEQACIHAWMEENLATTHPNDNVLPILKPIIGTCMLCMWSSQ